MNHDQNKKTLRQFQCRDYLWEIFEQMSAELECSVDYLINESMRQYARSRNYGVRTPGPGTRPPSQATPPGRGGGQPSIPSAPPPPPSRGGAPGYPGGFGAPPAPSGGGYPPPPGGGYPAPSAPGGYPAPSAPGGYPAPPSRGPAPSYGSPAPYAPPAPSSYPPPPPTQRPPAYPGGGMPAAPPISHQPTPYPQPGGYGAPPPLPGGAAAPMPGGGPMQPLFVIFNGQKFPVQKEEFIIGRGTKTADLPIKDGNISRRHAAVIWQNGGWYMKDLGSTNGVEFQGRKVDTKRIEEGDVYQLCDYEVRFTYR